MGDRGARGGGCVARRQLTVLKKSRKKSEKFEKKKLLEVWKIAELKQIYKKRKCVAWQIAYSAYFTQFFLLYCTLLEEREARRGECVFFFARQATLLYFTF